MDNNNSEKPWTSKSLKKSALQAIRKNYINYLAVCFIMVFVAGKYSSSIQFIASYDKENVPNIRYSGDFKRDVVEDLKHSKLSFQEISDKYEIGSADAVERWEIIYDEKGAKALNSKEISLFNTGLEISNWSIINRIVTVATDSKFDLNPNDDNKYIQKIKQNFVDNFDSFTRERSSSFQFVNSIMNIIEKKSPYDITVAFGSTLLGLAIALLVGNVLVVGERRFFLESRTYHKTKIGRMGFIYKERSLKPLKTMLWKDIYTALWTLTIVGVFIKPLEYMMIPFILAENPNIDKKHAFKLSKQMMKGNKFKAALLIFSFCIWYIIAGVLGVLFSVAFLSNSATLHTNMVINIFTGVLCLFFVNMYLTATKTELYIRLRRKAITEKYEFYEDLNDKYLDLDLLEQQLSKENNKTEKVVAGSFEIPENI